MQLEAMNKVHEILRSAEEQLKHELGYEVKLECRRAYKVYTNKELMDRIASIIHALTGITYDKLAGKSRYKDLIDARHILATISSDYGIPKSKIGRYLQRDHSAVHNYLDNFEAYYNTDDEFRDKYDKVKSTVINEH